MVRCHAYINIRVDRLNNNLYSPVLVSVRLNSIYLARY